MLTGTGIKRERCDVLVVGGGGAGLRAAIAAREAAPGSRVILATKGELGRSGVTALACSDRMAFHATLPHTEPRGEDAWRYHARDIYEIGGGVSDAPLAALLARKSREALEYLESLGVPFVKKDGLVHQFVTDGSRYARACYTGPKTAVHIEECLVRELRRLEIPLLEHTQVYRLLTAGNRVCGVLALTGDRPVLVEAGAVVLATGGGGEIYDDHVFPPGNSGDGYAAAYLAGAELVNMEFIQIGIASLKTKLNCSGSMMRAVPRVVNERGEEFLFNYFPPGTEPMTIYNLLFKKGATWPVSYEHPTRIFDIAFYKERSAGCRLFLDYSVNPTEFDFEGLEPENRERYRTEMKRDLGGKARREKPLNRLEEINREAVSWLQERGIDLHRGDMVEAATCIQHFQGGIKINARGETGVPGLYAAGECAGGQHGANRPGGNALLDGQVFGKICGLQAVRFAAGAPAPPGVTPDCWRDLERLTEGGGPPAGEVRSALQKLMTRCAGVVRTAEGLQAGLEELQRLAARPPAVDENGLAYAAETEGMLLVAETVLRSALRREESRGPHLRFRYYEENEPLPRCDPEWQRHIVIRRGREGAMELQLREPRREYRYDEEEENHD